MSHPRSTPVPPLRRALKGRGDRLGDLLEQVQRQHHLLAEVHAALPEELRLRCQYARHDGGELKLYAPSAAWAARLRYAGPQLLAVLRTRGLLELRRVTVRVHPPTESAEATPRHPLLTPQGAEILRAAAADLRDPDLCASILRLASRHR